MRPAPSAGNFNDGESLESWAARRDRLLAQGVNGIAVQLLPTPAARDWKSGAASEQTHDGNARPLNEVVRRNLLPTPRATDGEKGGPNQRGSSGDPMLPSAVQPSRWGDYAPAVARWEHVTGQPAPSPTEPGVLNRSRVRQCAHETGMDGWAATAAIHAGLWGARLSPRFSEWLMGLPDGWVTATPGVSRSGALTAIGNGQVPQCAAAALRALLGPVGESDAA